MTRSEILQVAKPILFNTEMVRAILDGRKTVTRRVVKGKIEFDGDRAIYYPYRHLIRGGRVYESVGYSGGIDHFIREKAPYKPGDYLYVRETWGCYERYWWEAGYYLYRSDYPNGAKTYLFNGDSNIVCDLPEWRPSVHMPKEAARIFLRVTDVRVERLSDMDYMDAIYEGIEPQLGKDGYPEYNPMIDFIDLWDSTIPPKNRDKYGWAANPYVWVIEFERVEVTE